MSRIRPVKPEAFVSETLAELTLAAERTFFGLTTECDDRGRHKDNAAIIYGKLWVVRGDQSPVDVENHLLQMERSGLICRYVGCDGKRYLHYVTWDRHQKIDKPSLSRLPACPHHAPERCGLCKGPCAHRPEASPKPPREFDEASLASPRALDLPAQPVPNPPALTDDGSASMQDALLGLEDAPANAAQRIAGQGAFAEDPPKTPRSLGEGSAPGSRILDPGSSFPTGRTAPDATASAKDLLAEYVTACAERPPGDVLGHLGRITKKLLDEGIAVEHIRAGLQRFAEIQGHPSRLPSLVNDSMNSRGSGLARPGFRPNVPAHQPWTNPVDAVAAYAEEL
ncbi:hypothetical protein AB0K51_01815 [Kitasatospora sp. NPDC049285]|uniref:hypothetical protein n=1 Tax=Kitasatospora sp. NPDC049285 TaxID=3157096 RepID=UPI00341DDB3E